MSDIFNGGSGKLTVEQTNRLIDQYRINGCLWDTKHPDYRNRDARAQVLAEVAETCNISVGEIETYIHSIRTSYCRQLKRIYAARNCRTPYVPRWIYFPKLDFLRPVIQPRTRRQQYPPEHHQATSTMPEHHPDDSVTEWSDDADSVVAIDPIHWETVPEQQERLQEPCRMPNRQRMEYDEEAAQSPPEVKHRPSPSLTLAISDIWDGAGGSAGSPHPTVPVPESQSRHHRLRAPFQHLLAASDRDAALIDEALTSMPAVNPAPNGVRQQHSSSGTAAAFGQFVGTYLETLNPENQHRAMLEIHQLLFQLKNEQR